MAGKEKDCDLERMRCIRRRLICSSDSNSRTTLMCQMLALDGTFLSSMSVENGVFLVYLFILVEFIIYLFRKFI